MSKSTNVTPRVKGFRGTKVLKAPKSNAQEQK
jgi:hypothetical protein